MKAKGRSDKEVRHVRLYHYMLRSQAWTSLDAVARCAYILLATRYAGAGANNGRLPMSVREVAENVGVSKATASRALLQLEDRGFIVATQRGGFKCKIRHSTEWRLTEFPDDVSDDWATKDFMKWKNQNTVSETNRTGNASKPFGIATGTMLNREAALR